MTRPLAIPSGLVALVFVGIALIWEPLDGIFRQTVMVNNLFLSILALLTALGIAALAIIQRVRSRGGGRFDVAIRALAIIEVVFLMAVWTTAFTTGAIIRDHHAGSGKVLLQKD